MLSDSTFLSLSFPCSCDINRFSIGTSVSYKSKSVIKVDHTLGFSRELQRTHKSFSTSAKQKNPRGEGKKGCH